ncbi:MAG: SGNH/GDSL hydrolase family protein [Rhodothermales bacterium]
MAKRKKSYLIWILAVLAGGWIGPATLAQDQSETEETSAFELQDGDRVVLLGNALIEAEQEYGYVELALTTRWPDRSITFRNIGWAGDTVYGEARGHYTNPPGPYEHLLDQVVAAQPTVLFVGYGANVAFEDTAGLARFEKGLDRLLSDLEDTTAARIVLLSPTPHEADASPVPANTLRRYNEALQRATDVVAEAARTRGYGFIDLFSGMKALEEQTSVPVTTNGVHLSDVGYYYMAALVEKGLGLPARRWSVAVEVDGEQSETSGATASDVRVKQDGGTLAVQPAYMPMPPPPTLPTEAVPDVYRSELAVGGLRPGGYALSALDDAIETASAEQWAGGVAIYRGPHAEQAEKLRRLIIEKNRLYFQHYRPQNETYLLGFRAYEQGQHANELEHFGPLIDEKELEIGRLRTPKTVIYTLASSTP